jgi:Flp pilus assembly protein TadB
MTLSPALLLIVLVGAFVGGGVVLLVNALTRHDVSPVAEPSSGLGRRLKAFGTRLPIAIGVGLLVLLVTRWVVAAVATGLLILFWDALFGGAGAEKRGIAKIEALAAWTESLRDTVAGAVGLEQAIPATAYAASPIIAGELSTMADRLRVRVPLPVALQRFAEDMDDASADLIIAALILNSRLRGPGLREVLTSLSESARAELDMRQRVSAGRRSTRRSVQIVVGVTLTFVFGLRIFNPGYVEPYASPVGQVVLLIVIGVFAAGVMWLRRLSRFETPERFLHFRTAP